MAIWSVVWQNEDLGIIFSRVRYKQLIRIVVDRCFLHSQAGLNMPCRSMQARRMSGCQGTPWSEDLDIEELHGAAWWRLRSGVERIRCFLYNIDTESTHLLPSTSGIMLILKG